MNEIENAPVDHRATEDARARVAEWTRDFNARWLLVVKSHLEIHLLPPLLRISARGETTSSGSMASANAIANDILPRDRRIAYTIGDGWELQSHGSALTSEDMPTRRWPRRIRE
jgi:hypothetical protein